MPRKKHKLGGGNIQAEVAYDPFPKDGLVKQYEQFIRDNVYYFCRQNPGLNREQVLFRAVDWDDANLRFDRTQADRAGLWMTTKNNFCAAAENRVGVTML